MAGLNFAHGIAQALWHGKLFHVDLNGQHGPRFDQDLRFGAGNLRGAFWTVDVLEGGTGRRAYDGYRHFDYKPPRTEDDEGVWARRRPACATTCSCGTARAAFRADPAVHEALAAARVGELGGADPRRRRDDRGPARRAARRRPPSPSADCAFEALDQLAMEHLLGAR